MKKRSIAITVALVATIAATTALAGCTGDHYNSISFAAQDTSYAVTSQGGSVVAYGNYLYFINGTRGYDDSEGSANVWDKVVKGALYRTELNGSAVDGAGYKTFAPVRDADTGLEFKIEAGEHTDYFDEPIDVVVSEKIAPKTIGTSGYSNGGIFIYDNYAYFASPVNMKNSTGTVQTTRTDYFMMPLDGGSPKKIYTSSDGVDTSSSAYAFYKFNDGVYLVVNEVKDSIGTIVSVKIDTKKAKVADPVRFENIKATSVYFPVRDTYYNGIDNNTVEDFIYFVRDVTADDSSRSGSVIEAMRPDGSENFVVLQNGKTSSIEAVRDGLVFIRTQNNLNNTVIEYDSLHNALLKASPTYKAAHETDGRQISSIGTDRPAMTVPSAVTATYAFRPDTQSNEVYFIGTTSGAIRLYKTDGSFETLSTSTGTIQFVKNNYLYYAGSSSDFYRVPLWSNMTDYGASQQLASGTTSAGISCDYAAGYFTYFAEVDQWADGYTFFYKLDGLEGEEPKFVGTRAEADIPTEEQIKEANGETDEEE